MSDDFTRAHQRARRKIGEAWPLLSDEEQEEAVAREMRALEEERGRREDESARRR